MRASKWALPRLKMVFQTNYSSIDNTLIQIHTCMYACLYVLWPGKGSLMKTQTRILDNRLYYTRKIELHRKGKKASTDRVTLILICPLAAKFLVLITVRRVHYGKMGKAPTAVCMHVCMYVCIIRKWRYTTYKEWHAIKLYQATNLMLNSNAWNYLTVCN